MFKINFKREKLILDSRLYSSLLLKKSALDFVARL